MIPRSEAYNVDELEILGHGRAVEMREEDDCDDPPDRCLGGWFVPRLGI